MHGQRDQLCDVPAIYFCEPTPDNVRRIAEDACAGLYSAFYLHFTTPLPRTLMEQLAQRVGASGAQNRIARVTDQYMAFECLESDLFTVSSTQPVLQVVCGATEEATVESLIEQQAIGLLTLFVSVGGQVPLVVAQRGNGVAEAIGTQLDARLRNVLASSKSTNLGSSLLDLNDDLGLQRPCIIILPSPISKHASHTHTYMCHLCSANDCGSNI